MELSPDLSLMEGSTEWKGALKKGRRKKIELLVKNPGNTPRKVTGKAIVHLDEAGEFIERSTITLNGKTG
ncbi:MAG: hypothetical protein EPO39_14650 [Candidatus Manganitrophaceae bacterium]|nr:MAG: hypothetical protein EPO39_14650 [Candidatus Manganitrophaceae bacterium]